ncbi:MAG: extracellular solute-binding protein [Propionibacteriaceae bacterium]|nr:extracellular solute-binding protein [Propionibacteriaceae bacterium]
MRSIQTKRIAALSAVVVAGSMALAGCGSNNGDGGAAADGKTHITINTFNNFGYAASTDTAPGADLYQKYMDANPDIVIDVTVSAQSGDARTAFTTALGTGSGAYDIQATEIDWMPELMANADKLVDLSDVIPSDRYQDWKSASATTADGKLIGAGTDIGPEGICYRADLFEAAGLPSDRESVATLLKGDWSHYFEVGQQFMAAGTGAYWFDSFAGIWQGMVNQMTEAYISEADESIIATDNADVKAAYDLLSAQTAQSAGLQQWGEDWSAGMKSATGFATMLCPAWIINNVKGGAGEDFVGWDIADVFPSGYDDSTGGGNWGGSYLVVPEQSKVKEEAKKLVEWLTAPEQQVAVFTSASNYPSAVEAQADSAVTGKTDAFLNNAPVGEIFGNRAEAVTVVPFKGGAYFDINDALVTNLNTIDVDKTADAATAWDAWVTEVGNL